MRHLPNKLTLSRVLLAPLFWFCALRHDPWSLGAACLMAIYAFVSDMLDGYLARRWGQVSNFGICFDPVADKAFVLAAFIVLMKKKELGLPEFPLILIGIREFLVLGLRIILLVSQKGLMAAERFGKMKAVLQFGSILLMSGCLWLDSIAPWAGAMGLPFGGIFWMVGLFTAASGAHYYWKNRRVCADAWNGK